MDLLILEGSYILCESTKFGVTLNQIDCKGMRCGNWYTFSLLQFALYLYVSVSGYCCILSAVRQPFHGFQWVSRSWVSGICGMPSLIFTSFIISQCINFWAYIYYHSVKKECVNCRPFMLFWDCQESNWKIIICEIPSQWRYYSYRYAALFCTNKEEEMLLCSVVHQLYSTCYSPCNFYITSELLTDYQSL